MEEGFTRVCGSRFDFEKFSEVFLMFKSVTRNSQR